MIKHILKLNWNKKGANSLVILEIFLAFLVLFAVLSFVFYNTDRLNNPLGFEVENRKYVRFGELEGRDSTERAEIYRQLKLQLGELDLVEKVGLSHDVSPFAGSNWCHGNDDNGVHIQACYSVVDHDFIEANGMNVIEGRGFIEDDFNAPYPPIMPNKHFMDEFFPGQSMVDSLIIFQGEQSRIVGVVEAFKYNGEFEESDNRMLLMYHPKNMNRLTNAYLKMDPSADVAYEEKISDIVEGILKSSNFVIQDAEALSRRANLETWIPMIALLSICGFLCVNVALGLFGVLSYAISKRRAEVGLRRAIGASQGSISSQFTMEIVSLAAFAVLLGTFFAIQVPLLKVLDVNQSIFYRGIIYSALIILAIVTICALYPSWQASRIQPAIALHED